MRRPGAAASMKTSGLRTQSLPAPSVDVTGEDGDVDAAMSWRPTADPTETPVPEPIEPEVEAVLTPRDRDLGGFVVRRLLPASRHRTVGPFVFFDHFGPTGLAPGQGLDVRPHPHINLATVTYLFAGEIVHRDSLGSFQTIVPGDINWMTAGRGIVHSERTGAALRASGSTVHGIQLWVGCRARTRRPRPRFITTRRRRCRRSAETASTSACWWARLSAAARRWRRSHGWPTSTFAWRRARRSSFPTTSPIAAPTSSRGR